MVRWRDVVRPKSLNRRDQGMGSLLRGSLSIGDEARAFSQVRPVPDWAGG